jgi:phage shock protein PspC (stress-responsive transcriptional regulator)
VGGVCAGLAVRLGVRERTIRVLVVITCLFYGTGFLLYAAAWLFVARWGEDASIAQRLTHSRRESNLVLFGLLVALVVLLALGTFARHGTGAVIWPLLLSAVALAAIWAGSSRDEKSHLEGVLRRPSSVPLRRAAGVHLHYGWCLV